MSITEEQSKELQKTVDEKLKKMFEDKKETPELLIPKQLPSFVKTPLFKQFLSSLFQYCSNFNALMKQYQDLQEKLASRVSDQVTLLNKEKQSLAKLQRELSYQYAAIIVYFNSHCMEVDKKRSNYKDQVFFEALIYLVERVMKEQFTREDFYQIQEQINRLFRTNRYNLIKKRHQNDEVLQRYPALKEQKQKNKKNLTSILSRAPDRICAYKKYEKEKKVNSSQDYTQTLGIPKESRNPDMEQRSPLLCTWLPSRKSMISEFSQLSSYKEYLEGSRHRNPHNLKTITTEQPSSRMANIGNNVVTNYQY